MHLKDNDGFLPKTDSGDESSMSRVESSLRKSQRFFEIVNQHVDLTSLLDTAVNEIQAMTGCEAVGIRILDENGQIPYRAHVGFSRQFYEQENMLSIDSDRCMCVRVIRGSMEIGSQFFTKGGSFLTQSNSRLLSSDSELEPGQTRNACHQFGYESVALVPLRLHDRILGLIHLADSRKNKMSDHWITMLEWTAQQLAIAIERIKTGILLKESRESLKLLGDNLPDGMIYRLVHKPDGERYFSYASKGCERLFGVKPEELKRDASVIYNMFSSDELERATQLEKESIENQKRFDIECMMTLPNGETRWFQWHSKPEKQNDGSLIWYGVCLNISRRKYAEEALIKSRDELENKVTQRTAQLTETLNELQETEYRYRTVADFTCDWEYWVNLDGSMQYVSPSCERISGYTPQEFMEAPALFRRIVLPEDQAVWTDHYHDSRKEPGPREIQFRIKCRDGAVRWIEHACQPVKGDRGEHIGFRASNRDITLRKESEIKLQNAYSEIEKLQKQLKADSTYLREEIKLEHDHENIIGNSDVLKHVLFRAEQIATTDTTVLILGETGTGKELLARAIHDAGDRKERPLIKLNCAALPANLIESELFGHEKGAFTGALETRIGRFELANNATLFLDEIGELPMELQSKLLRVLQDGEFERLGSSKTRHTNVRIIAATNRDLEQDVKQKLFRMDLWYRLSVFTITIPPLRERREDIEMIVNFMLTKFERKLGKQISSIPESTLIRLQDHVWPGNVRELENVIERAVINTPGNTLQLEDALQSGPSEPTAAKDQSIKSLADMEHDHILLALENTNWKIYGPDGAAALLDINPSTLRGRMRKQAIQRPPYKN